MLSDRLITLISHAIYDATRALNVENGADPNLGYFEDATREELDAIAKHINDILDDPRAGDATFHNKWIAGMKKDDWSWGNVFDEAEKRDPRMVPFHLLPHIEQDRERLFRAIAVNLSRV